MRIDEVRLESGERGRRLTARIEWESTDRPSLTLHYEIPPPFGEELAERADPFLLAALPAAMWHGETRIRVGGTVCPRLRDGLHAVMSIFDAWYDRCSPLSIQPEDGFAPVPARAEPRTGAFLSGGIDSLALLRANQLEYPEGHPGRIRDSLLVFGLNTYDLDGSSPDPDRLEAFEALTGMLSGLAESVGTRLVPVYTNVRRLYPDFDLWTATGCGAATVSTAVALPGRFDHVWIASGGIGVNKPPRGLHSRLTHHFSTSAVSVHHGQPAMRRLEKTRLVAEWDEGLRCLRTCFCRQVQAPPDLNCGRCEKCVRTMLALLALGALRRASTFPHDDLTPDMLRRVTFHDPNVARHHEECAALLERSGRHDLADVVREKIDAARRRDRGGSGAGGSGLGRLWDRLRQTVGRKGTPEL